MQLAHAAYVANGEQLESGRSCACYVFVLIVSTGVADCQLVSERRAASRLLTALDQRCFSQFSDLAMLFTSTLAPSVHYFLHCMCVPESTGQPEKHSDAGYLVDAFSNENDVVNVYGVPA